MHKYSIGDHRKRGSCVIVIFSSELGDFYDFGYDWYI